MVRKIGLRWVAGFRQQAELALDRVIKATAILLGDQSRLRQLLHQFTWPLLGAMVGFTMLIISAAVGIFQLGLRRYESGNLLGMQG